MILTLCRRHIGLLELVLKNEFEAWRISCSVSTPTYKPSLQQRYNKNLQNKTAVSQEWHRSHTKKPLGALTQQQADPGGGGVVEKRGVSLGRSPAGWIKL